MGGGGGGRLQKAMEGLGKACVLSEELLTLLQEFVCKFILHRPLFAT